MRARASLARQSTPDAEYLVATARAWYGDGDGCEHLLGAIEPGALTVADPADYLALRATNLALSRGAPAHALGLLVAARTAEDPAPVQVIDQLTALLGAHPESAGEPSGSALSLQWTLLSLYSRAFSAVVRGDLIGAEGTAQSVARLGSDRIIDGVTSLIVGIIRDARGDVTEASSSFETAWFCLRDHSPRSWRFWAAAWSARELAMLGDRRAAEHRLEFATEDEQNLPESMAIRLAMSRAWIQALRGDVSAAAHTLQGATRSAHHAGCDELELECIHLQLRFGETPDADRVHQLLTEGSVLGGIIRDHAWAARRRDTAVLLDIAGRYDRIGHELLGAEVRATVAFILRRRHRDAEAQALAFGTQSVLARLGAQNSPTVRDIAVGLPLTAREREIAHLVAEGYSNSEIARRVVRSVRTVEGHVYRACVKLSVDGRIPLARLVGRVAFAPSVSTRPVSPLPRGQKPAEDPLSAQDLLWPQQDPISQDPTPLDLMSPDLASPAPRELHQSSA